MRMEWWGFLLIALAVLAVLVGAFLLVQARRRRGGVLTTTPKGRS